MYKVKFNTHSLNALNMQKLEAYYKFHNVRPDEQGYITPTFSILKLIIAVSKLNHNARKLIEDNEELIAAVLSERKLSNSDKAYLAYANSPFINSILSLTSD